MLKFSILPNLLLYSHIKDIFYFNQIAATESLCIYATEEFNIVMYPYCFTLDNLNQKTLQRQRSFS